MEKEKLAQKDIEAFLQEAGFARVRWRQGEDAWGMDGEAAREGDPYRVHAKALWPIRRKELEGGVADAILRLGKAEESKSQPLIVVWVQRRSRNAVAWMREYMDRFAPGIEAWLIDARGARERCSSAEKNVQAVLQDPNGNEVRENARRLVGFSESREPYLRDRSEPKSPGGVSIENIAAPLSQWILKVLLLSGSDRRYWGGPNERPANRRQLALLSGASQPYAWKVVEWLRKEDYLAPQGEFRLRHLEQLLEEWRIRRPSPSSVAWARPLFPSGSVEGDRESILKHARSYPKAEDRSGPGVVVGSHAACHLLGVGRSNIRSLRLYARGSVEKLLSHLECVEAESGPVEIVQPREEASIFEGAVERGGLWVADALQCYLDVKESSLRGEEQAEFLWDRILQPWFSELGWF